MKNHGKNNKTNLLNNKAREYFENNYQQFLYQKVSRYRKNTLLPRLGKLGKTKKAIPLFGMASKNVKDVI